MNTFEKITGQPLNSMIKGLLATKGRGDLQTKYTGTKSGALSQVSINLNIWDTEMNRKKVSEICNDLFFETINMKDAYGFKVSLRVNDSGIQINQDRTVTPPVWRGMVNLVFDIL